MSAFGLEICEKIACAKLSKGCSTFILLKNFQNNRVSLKTQIFNKKALRNHMFSVVLFTAKGLEN